VFRLLLLVVAAAFFTVVVYLRRRKREMERNEKYGFLFPKALAPPKKKLQTLALSLSREKKKITKIRAAGSLFLSVVSLG
jgi:hypothetical protein